MDRSRSKERRSSRHSRKATDDASSSYKATSNPFNEESVSKKFVWKKKIEQDASRGLSREESEQADRERRLEAERELESLRKRRELREIERLQREQEMIRIRREQEQEKLGDWERREEEFHLRQAKKRAEIRIRNNRPKPIDLLAMNLRLANDKMDDTEVKELASIQLEFDDAPHLLVEGLSAEECGELIHEVEMYLSLETNIQSVEFWENLLVVCSAHKVAITTGSESKSAVDEEIETILRGKTLDELSELESEVQSKLSGTSGAVDVDYWEKVRSELGVERAKVTLAEMHRDMLERRSKRLRQAQLGMQGKHGALETGGSDSNSGDQGLSGSGGFKKGGEVEQMKRQKLMDLQQRILSGVQKSEPTVDATTQDLYEAEWRKEHDPSEAMFSVEAAVSAKSYLWQDKHRPRKPRYFNRVHTGYEWNKYNQTHYDKDNPPPKVVQGYKFNIFYPDLIDKSEAPTYRIEKDPLSEDTVILRFMAGPPYEDIAFRVVNREWEYNRRRGFKNVFDRGVLQLHFRFKRHFYRR
ncbi:hypothetical protein GGI07_001401 [Coemansia sp. Benny D115]|nr:hypothetical protein GGI07_001401 [Coemansia sp. Benny D115]